MGFKDRCINIYNKTKREQENSALLKKRADIIRTKKTILENIRGHIFRDSYGEEFQFDLLESNIKLIKPPYLNKEYLLFNLDDIVMRSEVPYRNTYSIGFNCVECGELIFPYNIL